MWQVKSSFYCFLRPWISFPCLYINSNCSIFFLFYTQLKIRCILWSIQFHALNIVSIFRQMKINIRGFGFFNYNIVFNVHSHFIITWLNSCKVFLLFYYAYTKDIVFLWLRVFGLNCSQVLFVSLFEATIFNTFPSFTPFDNAVDGTL